MLHIFAGGGSKVSSLPREHAGLNSGDYLPPEIWSYLINSANEKINFNMLHKSADILVVYGYPHRSNNEFRIVLDEFKRIPTSILKVSLAVINCDDSNDLRKFLKKNILNFPLLSDPSKAVSFKKIYF